MPSPDASHLTPSHPDTELTVDSADGTQLSVQIRGPQGAPAVVLCHGWTMSSDFFTHQYRDLAAYRVISYDQRGHGRSGDAGSLGFTPDALAADLLAVVTATLGRDEKAVFVGHSMGAMTIIAAAGLNPDLVRDHCAAAVLASTAVEEMLVRSRLVAAPLPLIRLVKRISAAVLAARINLRRRPDALSRAAIHYIGLGRSASPADVQFCTEIILGCRGRTRGGFGRMLGALDITAHVARLTVPTVLIVGTADRLTPPWHARRIAPALPNLVSFVEVPGAGHMTPLESPDVLAQAITTLATAHLPAAAA